MVHMIQDSFTNKESVREITFQYDADNPTDMCILEKINSVLDEQPLCTNCINCYKDGYYCGYSATLCKIHGNIEDFTSPYYDMDGSKCKDYKRK